MCVCVSVEYYPTLKKNEILKHATIWMNLESSMLREISKDKGKVLCGSSYMTSRTGNFMETEKKREITRSWVRRENGKLLFNGYRASI